MRKRGFQTSNYKNNIDIFSLVGLSKYINFDRKVVRFKELLILKFLSMISPITTLYIWLIYKSL